MAMPQPEELLVRDDERDFYGKHYFDTVAELHGLPPLDTRARADLPERCLHWLLGLLRYCSPPARVLELGSAHGGYVAMMRWAGFDATGLDLSPEIVAAARERFGVPVLKGPIESQDIEHESLDAIVLMDVLEHLGDPKETIRHCLQLLKPNGLIFLQTPRYREGKSLEQMARDDDPFLRMLTPDQHLYLFSRFSVKRFFRQLGVEHVVFEHAIFSAYDMALVASRIPPVSKTEKEVVADLESTPSGRLLLALYDLNLQYRDLTGRLQESEADRAVRLENILKLEKTLTEQATSRAADVAAHVAAVDDLTARLKDSEADRAVRLENILKLEKTLTEQAISRAADVAAQAAKINDLTTRLKDSEADRAVRLENILKLEKTLTEQAISRAADVAAQAAKINDLTTRLKESEADRAVRLENILKLEKILALEADNHSAELAAQTATINDLTARLKESEADRAVRLENIFTLEKMLADQASNHSATFTAQVETIEDMTARLTESQTNCAAHLENSLKLEKTVAEQAENHSAKTVEAAAVVAGLTDLSEDLRVQLVLREEQIRETSRKLRELESNLKGARQTFSRKTAELTAVSQVFRQENVDQKHVIEAQQRQLAIAESVLARMRESYVFRLMRGVRLWGWLEPRANESIKRLPSGFPTASTGPRRVVVDLTPVLPDGGNGGAKVMTLELIRRLCHLAPNCDFVLLTSQVSHDELAPLDGLNVSRLCINPPDAAMETLGNGSLVRQLGADLLFCPFTAPFYFDPAIPTVSVIYDLQHLYYPEFFDIAEIEERNRNLNNAIQSASKIICISEFVRNTVLEKTSALPECVRTVHILLPHRFGTPSPSFCQDVLDELNLVSGQFLLYPANFWPHKNHELLLTAFGIYLARNVGSEMTLVLTGSPGQRQDYLKDAARAMGLFKAVQFPGYLADEELSVLFHSCAALIFPSLFEGFGMPLLEAMAAGRPILCSNTTSLPEIAGDAALLFDPRKPVEIADAIARIATDLDLRRELAAKSVQRLDAFGGPEDMAASYLEVFRQAVQELAVASPGVYGVFEDGWVGERFTVAFERGTVGRRIRVKLELPEWVSTPAVSVRVTTAGAVTRLYGLPCGKTEVIDEVIGIDAGSIKFHCSPSFQPRQRGFGDDARFLTCKLALAEIISSDGVSGSFQSVHHAG